MTRRSFGSVRRRASGRYQAVYYQFGRRVSAPATFMSKADATAYLAKVEVDIHSGTWIDPSLGKESLATFAQSWIDTRTRLSPGTVELYQYLLRRHILPEFGSCSINRITAHKVRSWNARLAASNPSSAAKSYRLLSVILNTAVRDDLIPRSPCRIEGAGREHSPERPVISMGQAEALATAMPARTKLLVQLATWCGLRRGELLALRRCDINQLHRTISVERSASYSTSGAIRFGPPKSEAGVRSIHYSEHLDDAIESHLETFVGAKPDSLIFTGEKGAALRPHVLYKQWNTARLSLSLGDLHLHDLRHSHATWVAVAGATTRELMSRLGHASPAAALRYQHATSDRDLALAKTLGTMRQEAVTMLIEDRFQTSTSVVQTGA
jgi:integrase